MKRVYGMLDIGLALVWGMLILVTGTLQVQAQTNPNAPTAPNTVYLPLIASSVGKSGIHLGNRSSDWQPAFLQRIQPPPRGAADGHWPAAVVIQSNQVYDFSRDTSGPCWVNGATVKQNNQKDYAIYDYLTRAISRANGTIVVIRLTPSPGNFSDYDHPGKTHNLLATETPAGGDYCGDTQTQKHKVEKYRDIHDLAAEMEAIYQVNIAHGWPADHFYFEPANEPNYEWYQKLKDVDKIKDLAPHVDNKQAWIEMDNYFAALYDLTKELYPTDDLQVLTPSMSQGLYGEHYALGTCDNTGMIVLGGNGRTGLDFMKQIYGYDLSIDSKTSPKADGFAWHDYWRAGYEEWGPSTGLVASFDDPCKHIPGFAPKSDHLYRYFSNGIEESMSKKITFITEADLKAPCPHPSSFLITKDRVPGDTIDYAQKTRESMLNFFHQEAGARYVIAWLLVNQYPDDANDRCATNSEINWHTAYKESGSERDWFGLWWHDAP